MLCRSEEIQVLCVVEKSANMFSKVNKLQIKKTMPMPGSGLWKTKLFTSKLLQENDAGWCHAKKIMQLNH